MTGVQLRRTKVRRTLATLLLALVATLVVFPIYWTLVNSFKSRSEIFSYPPTFFPKSWDISAYLEVLLETDFLLWIGNTLVVSALVILGTVVVAAPASYALSRVVFAGKGLASQLILLTQMLPYTLIMVPMYVTFVRAGLIDTLVSVILMEIAAIAPIGTWMLKGFFDTIPREIEEAAMVDGCTLLQALRKVIAPLALPGLAAVVLFAFVAVWQRFIFAVTLVHSPSKIVLSVGLQHFLGEYTIQWNLILAASLLAMIPPLILFFCMQRGFVAGLTGGAVKN